MTLHRLILENFGVYGGRVELDLTPRSDDYLSRPILLFQGKNGVGKTTFVEALRLVLHGPLALGDRVARRDYQDYLSRRVHRPTAEGRRPAEAAITLEFEFVRSGLPHQYRVERRWWPESSGAAEMLSAWEDGEPVTDMDEAQLGLFLRDLVPPSAAELFFFDGERIDRLTNDEDPEGVLGDTVRRLLGLHHVEQLSDDLSFYIDRRARAFDRGVSVELEEARHDYQQSVEEVRELTRQKAENLTMLDQVRAAITRQEAELASRGGIYAQQYRDLKEKRDRLKERIATLQRELTDAASGPLPFACAPNLLSRLAVQLDHEAAFDRWQAAQEVLGRQQDALKLTVEHDAFWDAAGIEGTPDAQARLVDLLKHTLSQTAWPHPVPEGPRYLETSDKERALLHRWIDDAQHRVAAAFNETTEKLVSLQQEVDALEAKLGSSQEDMFLQPLVNALQRLHQEYKDGEDHEVRFARALGTAQVKRDQALARINRLEAQLLDDTKSEARTHLAVGARQALAAYGRRVRATKVSELETALVRRFNELCRKESLIEGVRVDPETFQVTLTRGGDVYRRDALSAGEQQLFAIATVWALREVSGVPMPVVVDTPLGRLDSDHRLALVHKFFPRVSHQVILLATDTEVDEPLLEELMPAVSHGYAMEFNVATGATELTPLAVLPSDLAAA